MYFHVILDTLIFRWSMEEATIWDLKRVVEKEETEHQHVYFKSHTFQCITLGKQETFFGEENVLEIY